MNNFEYQKWEDIEFSKLYDMIHKLQIEIYWASKKGNVSKVRSLQEKLINMNDSKIIAVHKITSSSGAKTPGVDRVCKLNSYRKLKLAKNLSVDGKADLVRRIWIPKTPTEKRPLGIPTIRDRAKQALVKLALEPEWEAKFEANSYGYRPGRSSKDALQAIRTSMIHQEKHILDGDVAKCFDKIDHDALLHKLDIDKNHILYQQIKAWLKAGIFERDPFGKGSITNPTMGTPQGGVISPLLANIALHGLEIAVKTAIHKKVSNKQLMTEQTHVYRYADDFVILAPTKEVLDIALEATKQHLSTVGLEIKPEKTRILHSTNRDLCPDRDNSFNFLGHTFKTYNVGKHKARKVGRSIKNYRVVLLPSKKNLNKLKDKISLIMEKTTSTTVLVTKLNPIIRGWSLAFNYSDASTWGIVQALDRWLYIKLTNWQKKGFHTKARLKSLWTTVGSDNWVFHAMIPNKKKEKVKTLLLKFSKVTSYSVTTYIKVKGDKSPFDGDESYWFSRMPQLYGQSSIKARLIRKQKGRCTVCTLPLRPDDSTQIDHKIPKALGGSNKLENLQLLHTTCHYSKTKMDMKKIKKVK